VLQDFRTVSERELQDATFFFMEFICKCDQSDAMLIYDLCNQYCDITQWSQVDMCDVRQNTIYGIGEFAKFLNPNAFKSLLPTVMKSIDLVLSNPAAMSSEHIAVTENAYVTLGKIALLHSKDVSQVNRFLTALPLSGDEEAQEAHQFLFEQVIASNQVLLGPCKDQMLKSVLAIQTAFAKNTDLLTEEGQALMAKVLAL
jgi:hypothetical protein